VRDKGNGEISYGLETRMAGKAANGMDAASTAWIDPFAPYRLSNPQAD
jgi:hypothetical protein